MDTVPFDHTQHWLEQQIMRAAYCANAIVTGGEFRLIHALAKRAQAYDIAQLGHLETLIDRDEVRLDGKEFRVLLMLALEAKRKQIPPPPRSRRTKH
jgi:hypothetical protein